MGVVWSAEHLQTGREFAIKFLHPVVAASSDDARRRFLLEAKMSARVNHPNIIDILDVGEFEDGSLYLVMELLEGMNFGDALRAEPRFNAKDLLLIVAGAATALGAAHAAGVIHRDVKPPNIFLHRDRGTGLVRTKVLDFGVSKVLADPDGVATHSGSLLGSPRYMAPEQAISATSADGKSDVWSLGVIMFEALTGQFPHDGDSSNSLVIAIATKPPKPIGQVAPNLPASLRLLVDDCLQPAPQRIQNASVLVDRILSLIATEDLSAIPLARPTGMKSTVVRPDSFIISSASHVVHGLATSLSRSSAAHLALPPPPEIPPVSTPLPTDTLVMDPSGRILSHPPPGLPVETPQPSASPAAEGADPAQSISSINVVRGDGAWAPLPSVQPPNDVWRANKSVLIALGAVAALLVSLAVGAAVSSSSSAPPMVATTSTPRPAPTPEKPAATAAEPETPAAASASAAAVEATASASATAAPAGAPAKPQGGGKGRPLPTAKPKDPLSNPGF